MLLLCFILIKVISTQGTCSLLYYYNGSSCSFCGGLSPCSLCDYNSGCSNCYSGFVKDIYNVCRPCPSQCTSCSSNICQGCVNNCSTCDATGCTSCISNIYYLSGVNCVNCPTHCPTCNATTCLSCLSPCQTCDHTQCLTCVNSNQFPSGITCLNCPIQCSTCNATTCQTCQSPCLTCNYTNCLTCLDKYYPFNNICVNCPTHCATCDQFTCFTCVLPCTTCNYIQCLSCQATDQYPLADTCLQCPSHCETCDQYRCYTCKSPCSTCDHYSCLTCTSLSQYVNQNTCLDCPSHCLVCTQTDCQICQLPCLTCDNYQCLTCLETNQYVFQTTCQNCPDHCLTCTQYDCLTCLSPCLTCNYLTCLSCEQTNQYIVGTTCYDCPDHCLTCTQSTCLTCISPCTSCDYYQCNACELLNQYPLGLTCIDCPDHCLTCNQDNCFSCANNCLTCSHTQCLSCLYDNQYIKETECLNCPDHCLTCDSNTCLTCVFPCETCDHTQCLTCQFSNYYPQEQTCQQCPDHCLTCNEQQCFKCIGNCLQCDYNECLLCPDRQYSLGIECFQCQDNCQSCNQIGCLACDPGYFTNYALQCQLKIQVFTCGNGFLDENEECDDGNLFDQDGCNSSCQIENNFICQGSQCIKNEIETSISVVYLNSTTTNQFHITLGGITNPECEFIFLSIEQFDQKDFQFKTTKFLSNSTHLTCSLELLALKSIQKYNLIKFIYTSSNSSRLLVEVIAEIIIVPRQQRYYDEAQMEQSKQVGLAQEMLSQTIFILGPSSILLGGFDIFWNILDILSWLNNLYFINVEYPQNAKIFFQQCEWADLQLIPNLYELESPTESPPKFMEKDIGPVFLNNVGMLVSIIGCTLIGFIVSLVVQKVVKWLRTRFFLRRIQISKHSTIFQLNDLHQKNIFGNQNLKESQMKFQLIDETPQFLKYLLKKSTLYRGRFFSNIISTINLSMLDIVLAICLQLTSSNQDLLNFCFTIFSILICFIILGVSKQQLERHHQLLNNVRYKQMYGTFYDNIDTKSRLALQFQYLSLLKKIMFTVFLVIFYDKPILQTTFCCLSQFLTILILIANNPYHNKEQYIQNGVPDIMLFFVLFISVGIALDDIILWLSEKSRFIVGWIIIGCIGTSISIQLFFLIKELILDIYQKIRYVYNKMRK